MIDINLFTPQEIAVQVARSAREMRLTHNLSQETLSTRSGVSLGVLKKFEQTGKISLESLLKLALALGSLKDFQELFKPPAPETYSTLDDLLKQHPRKRGRK